MRAPCVCVCGCSSAFVCALAYAHTHPHADTHREIHNNVCTHILSGHVSVGICSCACMLSSRSTQGHVWIAGYTRPYLPPTHLLLHIAEACPSQWHFSRKLSTCRRHRHGRPVLLVPILILHARVPTRSRSYKSDPANACKRLSLAPIPSQLANAKVRASALAPKGAVSGARDYLRSVAPAAGNRA